ncbi:MAG: N-6 DNA methylase [Candidatus Thiodiazotropha sp.]
MNKKNDSIYTAIRIEGGLLSTSLLDTLRHYGLPGQVPADYGIEKGLKLADELGRYWRIAQARWEQFTDLRARSDIDRNKLAVEDWLSPLFTRVLGFEIEKSTSPASIGERLFPVTHTACNGVVPLVLTRDDQTLDKGDPLYGQEGRKRSPMGLAQEYLNAEDNCLWAMVSNGLTLRLLRDNPAMTRPAYVEVDLERIFSEELYVDFTVFWLLLHGSRFLPRDTTPNSCYLEQWRDQGQTDGERVLGQLRYGVTDALRLLGTGFVSHPGNKALRAAIQSGELTTDRFFQELLRLIYRFLFLLTTEDRDILLDPDADVDARNLYRDGYSISNLRDRARLRRYWDRHEDAWQQLLISFSGFSAGQPRLGQPALGGLFAPDQCPVLEQALLANRYLFNALFKLCWFESDHVLVRINYRDMDTEELGSVYESLLELIPQLNVEGQWHFGFMGDEDGEGSTSGHARKLTGSYYTPDVLVQELIQSALEPVISQRLQVNPANPREALLNITVCDPACGSGHFLLAAARRLAAELARIDAGVDQPSEADYRHALRQVVRHCIYGVDMNPLAVELCRTALWLEAIEPGKPLGFLDAHIQLGNSLVGILNPGQIQQGIPAEAYKPLTGDSKPVAAALKKRNKIDKQQMQLLKAHHTELAVCAGDMEALPEENLEQVEEKRAAWRAVIQGAACQDEKQRADLFTSAFFAAKTEENAERVPTNVELMALERGEPISGAMGEQISELANTHRFFHWFLAFPDVFEENAGRKGGFDVMLGNPPWDVSQLSEEEYFSARAPSIANLSGAKRKKAIEKLEEENLILWEQYQHDKHAIEGRNQFYRSSGRNNLAAKGKLNLYALFAEHFLQAIGPDGRSGFIVPTGIATDDSTKDYFAAITSGNRLVSLFDLENREKIFPAVDSRMKFSLLTLGTPEHAATLAFFATQTVQLKDARRRFHITADEFALINPNTRTCPVFRSERDAELTKKLYRAATVLIREATEDKPEQNPWGVRFSQGLFNMTSASHLFRTHEDLTSTGATETGATWQQGDQRWLPLYEAKMVHQYDHRWATYETDGETSRDCILAEKQNPDYHNCPRYWVDEWQVSLRTARAPKPVIDAAKKEDSAKLTTALRTWAAGAAWLVDDKATANKLLQVEPGHQGNDLFAGDPAAIMRGAQAMASEWPLTETEYRQLAAQFEVKGDVWPLSRKLLEARRPKYLLGWRDICRSTNERTVIAGVIPLAAVGDTFLLMFPAVDDVRKLAGLLADQCSIVHDFVARQKIGGTHLKYHMKKQITNLPPERYTQTDLDFIFPRVLELAYTSHDLKPFAEDLGYTGEPFPFDPKRRHQIKCELDAYYARLYQLIRDELCYILDPADVMGEDYPSETFRVLKKKEIDEFKAYRTRDVVLQEFNRLTLAEESGQPYQSLLNPQPGVAPQPTYSPIGVIRHDNDARLAGFILVLIKTEQNLSRSQLSLAIGLVQHPESAKLNSSDDELSQLERFSQPFTGTGNTDSFDRVQQFLRYLEGERAIRVMDQGKGFKYVDDGRVSAAIHIMSETEAVARVALDILARKQAAEAEEGRQDAVDKIPPKQA